MSARAADQPATPADPASEAEPFLVDVLGKRCPIPMLRAKLALKALAPSGRVRVLATDPASVEDFRVFHEKGGCSHYSVSAEKRDGRTVFAFLLVK